MIRPGPLNLITDIDGITVGNAEDARAWTGVTVLLATPEAVAAVDVRGGGPGTRETDALTPGSLVETVNAIVLAGGSVFGLDAAGAVTEFLGERGIGYAVGPVRAPIVPAAILFDLLNGGAKEEPRPNYRELGRTACGTAARQFGLGTAGAGYGARAGALKGGLGSVSAVDEDGLQVGALVAVNSHGSAVMPGQSCFWAWPFELDDELGGQIPPTAGIAGVEGAASEPSPFNTTIGVVATNARLTREETRRVAIMAQDGYARAIRPIHTPFDGDTIFALALGHWPLPDAHRPVGIARIGALAADCVARAVARGVYEATALGAMPSYRDEHGKKQRR
jgi:L-aminopeptidase/D-esterase-like protein